MKPADVLPNQKSDWDNFVTLDFQKRSAKVVKKFVRWDEEKKWKEIMFQDFEGIKV